MDARSHADEVLARARAREAGVVTPDFAVSPMDLENTVQIPRTVLPDEEGVTESTMDIPIPSQGDVSEAADNRPARRRGLFRRAR